MYFNCPNCNHPFDLIISINQAKAAPVMVADYVWRLRANDKWNVLCGVTLEHIQRIASECNGCFYELIPNSEREQ